MFFKNDPAAFDDLVIEYEISLDRIVSHEFLALVKVGNVVLKIIDECFGVKVRDDVPDFIVLLQNGGDCVFYVLVTLHELNLFFENSRSKITNILNLFLEVHQLEGRRILHIKYGFG